MCLEIRIRDTIGSKSDEKTGLTGPVIMQTTRGLEPQVGSQKSCLRNDQKKLNHSATQVGLRRTD